MIARKFHNHLRWPVILTALLVIQSIWALFGFRLSFVRLWLDGEKESLEQTRNALADLTEANNRLAAELAPFWTMKAMALGQSEENGPVFFRERIEKAAAAAGMQGRNTGNIRQFEVEHGVFLYEVAFAADGGTREVLQFLQSMQTERPRLYFRTLSIKSAVPGQSDVINVSGTICALNFVTDAARRDNTPKRETTP